MIVDERMVTFINSLDEGHTEFLEQLEKEAREDAVPIVRREMQSFLKFLMAAARPKRILEVGTAVGFSALLMCEYNPEPCQIITIENYEKRIPIARENFKKAGKEGQIELLEGDAAKILPTLTEPFDFIFMDPPYRMDLPKKVLEALKDTCLADEETLIIAEEALDVDFSWAGALGYEIVKIKEYQTNKHVFLKVKEV